MMKMKLYVSLFLMVLFSNAIGQTVKLSNQEMLEDFDQLVTHINDFAVHKELNAIRLGINYEKGFQKLREGIDDNTSVCDFNKTLNRATFLVQDQHCCFMPLNYLQAYGKYQNKFNFKDKEKYEGVSAIEKGCQSSRSKLNLPLLYHKGAYYVYADFYYGKHKILRGDKIVSYNGKEITSFIKGNYDRIWPAKWDENNKQPYNKEFYKIGEDDFSLTFSNGLNKTINFNLQDSINLLKEQKREINYYSQSKEQVQYFSDQNALYIGLPFMDLNQGKSINSKVDSLVSIYGSSFDKIIVDIRGNPGGSDRAWRTVLGHLIPDEIKYNINLKFKYNKEVIDYYNKGKKNTKAEEISLLNNSKFWTQKNEDISIKPDKNSIRYKGEIYVLQDRYIYSSAGNFSSICLNSDQLISVGEKTDIVGGLQTDPLFFKLKNSGLVLRIEPLLDFSGVNDIAGFSHNQVEIEIPCNVDDYFLRTTYEGDIYGKEFLLKHDRLVKFVLDKKL